uniref:Go opsin 1 n=1 Tax=Terebratalia transversa TaxID=34513 RepID=M9UW28_TERTR|nr:Go opsin 1 [Terebratalia transversa]
MLVGGILAALVFVGVTENTTAIYFLHQMKKNARQARPFYILLHAMTACDILVLLTAGMMSSISGLSRKWLFGDAGCKAYAFLSFFFALTNENLIVGISLYRYIFVCKPHYKEFLSTKNVYYWIAMSMGYSVFWCSLPLLGFSNYELEPIGIVCSANWQSNELDSVSYTCLIMFFCFILQAIILGKLYHEIVNKTKGLFGFAGCNSSIITKMKKLEKRRNWLCLLLVLTFIITWSPYAIISMLRRITGPIDKWIHAFPILLAKTSPVICPIIYRFAGHDFNMSMPCSNCCNIHVHCSCLLGQDAETIVDDIAIRNLKFHGILTDHQAAKISKKRITPLSPPSNRVVPLTPSNQAEDDQA